MALFDALFEFSGGTTSGGQSVITSAASEDTLDMQAADLEMGAGTPLYLNIKVGTTAYTGGTSVTFALVNDSDNTIDGSSTVIWQSPAIVVASLTANAWVKRMALPVDFDSDRYIGLYYTVSGSPSAGTIRAWIDHGPQSSYDTQVAASNI
jgi:hypothetical protein